MKVHDPEYTPSRRVRTSRWFRKLMDQIGRRTEDPRPAGPYGQDRSQRRGWTVDLPFTERTLTIWYDKNRHIN